MFGSGTDKVYMKRERANVFMTIVIIQAHNAFLTSSSKFHDLRAFFSFNHVCLCVYVSVCDFMKKETALRKQAQAQAQAAAKTVA